MYDTLLVSRRTPNKKAIVPSVGWVTSIAPAIQLGFEPIMCEADPDTFGLDLNHLEVLLQRHEAHTVMLVQVLGVPHKMNEIIKLKERYGFILLEDACAAIGATYQGKKVGTFGDMASFSFYFGHQMSTIEGGLVSTDDQRSMICSLCSAATDGAKIWIGERTKNSSNSTTSTIFIRRSCSMKLGSTFARPI